MTVTLSPETEARLVEKARREGKDVNAIVDSMLATALEWETVDREEAVAGIQRGLEDAEQGRLIPAHEAFERLRGHLAKR